MSMTEEETLRFCLGIALGIIVGICIGFAVRVATEPVLKVSCPACPECPDMVCNEVELVECPELVETDCSKQVKEMSDTLTKIETYINQ